MRKLAILACVIILLSFIVGAAMSLTTNSTVTNEVAIEQLNGGDEAYLAMQAYNQYKGIMYVIPGSITVIAVTVILLAIYKIIFNKHD